MDITYIPMARGFVYLTVVLGWYSRRALSHRISITMDTEFCQEAVQEAVQRYGPPQIMNTDQGSQFTSQAFAQLLKDNDNQISMDGKGAWRDNVFVQRLWRSIKYEEVYLHGYDSVQNAKSGLIRNLAFYHQRRPHSTLDGVPPDQVYFDPLPVVLAA